MGLHDEIKPMACRSTILIKNTQTKLRNGPWRVTKRHTRASAADHPLS